MKKNRDVWSFILTLAMLTAEIGLAMAPIGVYAQEPEYYLVTVSEDTGNEGFDDISAGNDEDDLAEDVDEYVDPVEMTEATPEDAFTWDGDTIKSYTGNASVVMIPKRAKIIAQGAFQNNNTITSLSFEAESQCTKIDTGAFKDGVPDTF